MVVLHLLKEHGHQVHGMFVHYGQAAAESERRASLAVANFFEIEWTERVVQGGPTYAGGEIQHRNAMLIFVAAMQGGSNASAVSIGIHGGVPYTDCSQEFIAAAQSVLHYSAWRPALIAPLQTWLKPEIIAYAASKGLPLDLTFSCEAGATPCGTCLSCLDRIDL